jgi:hypothetical protein
MSTYIITFVFIFVFLWKALCFIVNEYIVPNFLFMPPPPPHNSETCEGLNIENGLCWCEFNENNTARNRRKCIVFLHGNATDIRYSRLAKLLNQKIGCTVFVPEYPHYSFLKNLNPNLTHKHTLQYLKQFHHTVVEPDHDIIIYVGQSLGSHFATLLASEELCDFLCLISPFTSLSQVVQDKVGFIGKVITGYDSVTALKKVPTLPLLVIHGNNDKVIDFNHGMRMTIHNVNSTFITHENKGHNDMDMNRIVTEISQWVYSSITTNEH